MISASSPNSPRCVQHNLVIPGCEGVKAEAVRRLDIAGYFLQRVLAGERPIPDSVAEKLGYKKQAKPIEE